MQAKNLQRVINVCIILFSRHVYTGTGASTGDDVSILSECGCACGLRKRAVSVASAAFAASRRR